MGLLKRDPDAAAQRAAERRQRAAADAARLTAQDRRREALAAGRGGSGIQWQADTNPLNLQRCETYAATNGLPRDDPSYTVVHLQKWHGDPTWYSRTWVGPAQAVEPEHASLADARRVAEATLASPPPAQAWDEASWADAATTTHAPRDPAKPCGKRRSDGGRCRNVGDCPHHP